MANKAATLITALAICSGLRAETVYVSPSGEGSVQAAVDALEPGDKCIFHGGVYRESVTVNVSGTAENPIGVVAQGDALFDGTDPVSTSWTKQGACYRTRLPGPLVEHVFENGVPMTQARWPNSRFSDTWIRSTWASSAKGSKKDLMVCNALAETGIDWTGATAVLNVGRQYKTWTRRVRSDEKGANQFTYELAERLGDGKIESRTVLSTTSRGLERSTSPAYDLSPTRAARRAEARSPGARCSIPGTSASCIAGRRT